jgi:hypothetical protein
MKRRIIVLLFISCAVILGCEKGIWDLERSNPNDASFNGNSSIDTLATLTTENISNISSVSAISGGNISYNGGSEITVKGIVWSTAPLPSINDNKTSDGSGNSAFSSQLSNLLPNTTYYIRAYAQNKKGIAYGNEISFKTLLTGSLPTLTTNSVSAIGPNNAVAGGNITNDGSAAITGRGVCWGLNQNPTIANSKTTDGGGAGAFTSNITNLSPNTKYYVRAYATNTFGTSYGSEVNFTTPPPSISINNDLNKIQFIDNSIGYACGNGIIVKTTNGGTSWTSIRESNAINFTSINFTTELNGYAGGNDQYYSYVFRTTNGGLTWQEIGKFWFSNERSKVTSIFASVDGSRIVALVNQYPNASQVYGHMYYSSNSGATWLSTGVDRAAGFNAGDYYNNRIFIGGHQYWTGTTYRTNVYENTFIGNGATVFTTNLVDNSINFNDIDIVSSYGFGVSDNGQLAITTDNAKNWSVRTIPGYATINFTSVKFIDNNTGYISTEDGKVLKTDNSGLAWNLIYTATKNIYNLALRPDGKVYAVGQTGLLTAIN